MPAEEEGEEEAPGTAAPGFSPFAGAAEPGSEPPGVGTTPAAAAAGGEHVGAWPAPPPPPTEAVEAAAEAAPAAVEEEAAACGPEERAMHGSWDALASLGERPPPRPPALPRHVSADDLARVESLALGIPRVRTRPQLAPPPPAAGMALPPDLGVEVSSAEELTSPLLASSEEAEGVRGGLLFRADDLQAGESAAAAAVRTASSMLRDVRGIGASPPPGTPVVLQPSAELPISFSPAESPPLAAPGEAGEPTTPAYRSAALHRLAALFGFGPGAAVGSGAASAGLSRASSAEEAAAAAGEGAGLEEAEAGSAGVTPSAPFSPGGFSPVRRYIEHRRARMAAKQQRRARRAATAAAQGTEPEPPTPLPSSLAALFGVPPLLAEAARLPATPAAGRRQQQQQQQQQLGAELMREAMDFELREARAEQDATGSLVVGMLSKKLERLARETKRQQRLARRAARQRAKAAAAAPAAAAPADVEAPAPAGPPTGAAEAAPKPAVEEEAAAAAAPELQGFGGALKRLLGDPQVVTFFALCTVLGFGHGIIGGFLFMFLAEHGGGELLMGAVLTANSLPELPAFFFFGAIMQALGMQTLLLSAAAALGLRIWAYSLLPAVGLRYVVLLETLHAITYACGWSGCAVNSSKIAPPGLESTTQGLFQGLWTGVGCGLAGLLGGILYGSHGPIVLFRVSGLAILGCTAAAGVPMLVVHRRRKAAVARDLLPSPESLADLVSLGQ